MNLEKRCINRTFPQVITVEEDKCKTPSCKGYDKFCPQYVPTGSFNLTQIEEALDAQDSQKGGKKDGNYNC